MSKKKKDSNQGLRQRAEGAVRSQPELTVESVDSLTATEALLTLHELRVYQIELEMQNEELRQTEVKLSASRARYFDLYDLAPVGYCTLNLASVIKETNFTTASLLGHTRHALTKHPISHFICKEDQGIYLKYRKDLVETDSSLSCELRMIKADGSKFWARLEGIIAKDIDEETVIRLVISDVTKREQELLAANLKIKEANEELEAFNSAVSHDLRSPLNSIMSFSKIISEEHEAALPEGVQAICSHVIGAAQRMSSVIDGLFELSRVSRMELMREEVDLSEMAEGIAVELKKLSPQRTVSFQIAKNIKTSCDARLVSVVLCNLLNNAFKFTANKNTAVIEFGCLKKNGEDIYYVQDNGAGFDMRHINKLFISFERLHGTDEFPGTGIGLATVKRAIKRHSGKIWAHAEVNKGATFYFTLK